MTQPATSTVMDLVAAYAWIADAEELNELAAGDAPATSPVCASAAASYLASRTISATYQKGC